MQDTWALLDDRTCLCTPHPPKNTTANVQTMVCSLHVNRLHQGTGEVLATSLQQSMVFNILHEEKQNIASGLAASYLRKSHPCKSHTIEVAGENLTVGEVTYTHVLQGSEGLGGTACTGTWWYQVESLLSGGASCGRPAVLLPPTPPNSAT